MFHVWVYIEASFNASTVHMSSSYQTLFRITGDFVIPSMARSAAGGEVEESCTPNRLRFLDSEDPARNDGSEGRIKKACRSRKCPVCVLSSGVRSGATHRHWTDTTLLIFSESAAALGNTTKSRRVTTARRAYVSFFGRLTRGSSEG
jgi:hypothetical protein